MITGVVTADEARVQIKVKGLRGRQQDVEAVVDTGFTASLTLPPSLIAALGLRCRSVDRGTLADGSVRLFDVYEAKVIWDGKLRRILVNAAETEPLLGMRLLRGFELSVQVRARGKVTVRRLASR